MTQKNVLTVSGLSIAVGDEEGDRSLVRDVNFSLAEGRTIGIVGESGSGKTLTSLALMGLLSHPLKVTSGSIKLAGEELVTASEQRMRELRGNRIAMVFQEPMTSLNPVLTIGYQLSEALMVHSGCSRKTALEKAVKLLERVKIPNAQVRVKSYPHELSGGMRQRVMIAMAMMCDPKVIVADEPTTALDVTVQAEVLMLLKDLQREFQTAVVFISHDLGVIGDVCDDVMVMYRGDVVETGTVTDVLKNPKHAYTAALLAARPAFHRGDQAHLLNQKKRLADLNSLMEAS
ncbi:ABC transporter ATP-binding protein [Burkholderia anthina]|uniref:ABC transporter ATP-binding protein n=1 Tax=Burkholderia anthina TaxID=179879 RepID=UPI00158D56EB|nr:ABC transporter ATP-binding protein [Burkholderia anthina]